MDLTTVRNLCSLLRICALNVEPLKGSTLKRGRALKNCNFKEPWKRESIKIKARMNNREEKESMEGY